jgi:hypothetical protein
MHRRKLQPSNAEQCHIGIEVTPPAMCVVDAASIAGHVSTEGAAKGFRIPPPGRGSLPHVKADGTWWYQALLQLLRRNSILALSNTMHAGIGFIQNSFRQIQYLAEHPPIFFTCLSVRRHSQMTYIRKQIVNFPPFP